MCVLQEMIANDVQVSIDITSSLLAFFPGISMSSSTIDSDRVLTTGQCFGRDLFFVGPFWLYYWLLLQNIFIKPYLV